MKCPAGSQLPICHTFAISSFILSLSQHFHSHSHEMLLHLRFHSHSHSLGQQIPQTLTLMDDFLPLLNACRTGPANNNDFSYWIYYSTTSDSYWVNNRLSRFIDLLCTVDSIVLCDHSSCMLLSKFWEICRRFYHYQILLLPIFSGI